MAEKGTAPREKKEPKVLVFNEKVLDALRKAHCFRDATPGKSHDSPITGASSRWLKKDGDSVVYDPMFRLKGTREDIRKALTEGTVPADKIEAALEGAYTKENTSVEGAIRDQYLGELIDAKTEVYAPRDHGMTWVDIEPFVQAKKSDIQKKGKAPKKTKKPAGQTAGQPAKLRKKKTTEEIRKDLIAKKSDFVLAFTGGQPKKVRGTTISSYCYFIDDAQHIALQTPEDLAAAKAVLTFGDFDVEAAFHTWYQTQAHHQTATGAASAPAPTSAAATATTTTTATAPTSAHTTPAPSAVRAQVPAAAEPVPVASPAAVNTAPAAESAAAPKPGPARKKSPTRNAPATAAATKTAVPRRFVGGK